jgi:UDP-2,3-diacylglucosamine pyrophosphatase LpxH
VKKVLFCLLILSIQIAGQDISVPQLKLLINETKIAVISDVHLHQSSLGISGKAFEDYLANDRKLIAESEPILKSALNIINAEKPNILLIPGDLTKDGEKLNHQKLAEYLSEVEKSGTKVFVIPGNHDINNPEAYSYSGSTKTRVDNITADEFKSIYAKFGYEEAIYKDVNSVSYIAEPTQGLWLFAIDACRYKENTTKSVTAGKLTDATFNWIKEKLVEAKKKGKIAVGMMHHGALEHYTGQKALFPEYVIDDYEKISSMFAANGMRAIFTGHYHANDITSKSFSTGQILYDIETGSLVTHPCPVRFVTLKPTLEAIVTTKTVEKIDYDTQGKTFPEYAQNYLYNGMKSLVYTMLTAPISYGGYGISADLANQASPLLASGFVAHYKGDEKPDAAMLAAITSMVSSPDANTKFLGQSLYSLYTDLLPADNNTTLDFRPYGAIAANPKVLFEKNGVKIYNGGYGSSLAVKPGEQNYFYMLTDRGPNADATTSDKKVFPLPSFNPHIGKFRFENDSLKLETVINLKDTKGNKLTGLTNLPNAGGTGEIGIDLSGNTLPTDSLGVDPEGLVVLKDGSFWVSDEYGPHIIHFDANGNTIERINPFSKTKSLPKVLARRRPNRGMEGLSITPDEKYLVGLMQSPLYNPSKSAVSNSLITRIIVYDIAAGTSKQYVYLLEKTSTANSEIAAIDSKTFLVLERDSDLLFGSPKAMYKSIYKISLDGATDVSDALNSEGGKMFGAKTLEELNDKATLAANGIIPVQKKLVINLIDAGYIHDKVEGLAILDNYTIAVSNDDDFGITADGNNGFAAKMIPTSDPTISVVDFNEVYFIHFATPITQMTTDVKKDDSSLPTEFSLEQNYPNPFNPSTTIEFTIPVAGKYSLKVYDMLGQEVTTIIDRDINAGYFKVNFNASNLVSGVYIYRLSGNNINMVKKMILMK